MNIIKFFEDQTSVGISDHLKLGDRYQTNGGTAIPFQIVGITNAIVVLEATIATDHEVQFGTAKWTPIFDMSFSADTCVGLFIPFPYIRANITNYTSGVISVKTYI